MGCQISRDAIEVNLKEHGMDGYEHHLLSRLEGPDARRALYRAVRGEHLIREGVQRLVLNLRYRRKRDAETAGIVFVGNDDGDDLDDEPDSIGELEVNRYAEIVKKILAEEADDLKCVIATSKVDGDPAKAIEDFARDPRYGDVLVVKMMASAGLDIARLKVELDLSTVRTAVSFVQRVMRICTRWEREEGEPPVLRATYITPDDIRGRDLYRDLVYELGGASEDITWDEETGELVEKPYEAPVPIPLTEWEVTGTDEGEYLMDSDGTTAPGDTRPYVDALFDANPAWTRVAGKAELGSIIAQSAQEYAKHHLSNGSHHDTGAGEPPESQEPDDNHGDDLIDNVQGREEVLRKNINRAVRAKTTGQLRQQYDGRFPPDAYGKAIEKTWGWLYREAGVPFTHARPGERLKSLREPQLRRMWEILQGVRK